MKELMKKEVKKCEQLKKGQNHKGENGITLIALVVTIIVLLILAGVSIQMITGQNGILKQAQEAKKRTIIGQINENMQTDLFEKMTNNQGTDIKDVELYEILDKYFDLEHSGDKRDIDVGSPEEYGDLEENNPWKDFPKNFPKLYSKPDNYEMEIGDVFKGNVIPSTEALQPENYGKVVKEYTVKTDDFTSGVWKLFYQDKNYTYIIADGLVYLPDNVNKSLADLANDAGYTSGNDVSNEGKYLNSKLDKAGTFFISDNTTNKAKGLAYLTDTTKWTKYVTGNAKYAIATPTLELFAKSYNATRENDKMKIRIGNNGYKITVGNDNKNITDNSVTDVFKAGENGNIYRYGIGKTGWWISSPISEENDSQKDNIWYVSDEIGTMYTTTLNGKRNIRPVVCIPTNDFNSTYTLQ